MFAKMSWHFRKIFAKYIVHVIFAKSEIEKKGMADEGQHARVLAEGDTGFVDSPAVTRRKPLLVAFAPGGVGAEWHRVEQPA